MQVCLGGIPESICKYPSTLKSKNTLILRMPRTYEDTVGLRYLFIDMQKNSTKCVGSSTYNVKYSNYKRWIIKNTHLLPSSIHTKIYLGSLLLKRVKIKEGLRLSHLQGSRNLKVISCMNHLRQRLIRSIQISIKIMSRLRKRLLSLKEAHFRVTI